MFWREVGNRMKNTYFITGINGFLGRTIAKQLQRAGDEVAGLRMPGDKSALLQGITYYKGDVSKRYTLSKFIEAASENNAIIIHCAGLVSIATEHPKLWAVNVDGTRNIVDLCEEYHIRKLVCVSSVHAIPEYRPGTLIKETDRFSASLVHGAYGKSKAEAAAYVSKAMKRGLPAVMVHPSGIIGPGDTSKSYMTEMIRFYVRHGLPMAVQGGYDFVDVRDVTDGIIRCAKGDACGECYILSNEYISVRRLFDALSDITGRKKVRGSIPLGWIRPFAPLCEKISGSFQMPDLITPYSIYTLGSNADFSHEKADRLLGYHTRPLEETLENMVAWIKNDN